MACAHAPVSCSAVLGNRSADVSCVVVCRSGGDGMQELIVVTLLVAVQGKLQLPKITSREELVTALNRLGAVREDQASCCAACDV